MEVAKVLCVDMIMVVACPLASTVAMVKDKAMAHALAVPIQFVGDDIGAVHRRC